MFTNWLAPPATSLPPDTIIEVGPPPFTRYAAHSALVSAHSGYLRAALRSDNSTGSTDTIPIYVPNVTAEQFTPLLTYMYTGFLDLNIENIFGVLLATHILHMPRALELCRAFLSATQSENYFSGLNAISAAAAKPKLEAETSKVVRPIASKATGIGLNFIAPPTSHILLPSTHTPFKSLSGVVLGAPPTAANTIVENDLKCDSFSPPGNAKLTDLTETTNSIATAAEEPSISSKEQPAPPTTTSHKRSSKSLKRASSSKSDSVITTASKDSAHNINNDKGIIIDIASCDGPVRFRRVLNDSYGTNSNNNNNKICTPDESKSGHSRYMSTSFHQQMVRNINERKQSLASGESCYNKDENSQDNNRHSPQSVTTNTSGTPTTTTTAASTGETYNCVYCKHTFKSQYCYQKHAKRHLIPLTLDVASDPDVDSGNAGEREKDSTTARHGKSSHYAKREVKPLDMNVQYYPCKTCGSKFPSYYFVHKHRKMCHADEEVM